MHILNDFYQLALNSDGITEVSSIQNNMFTYKMYGVVNMIGYDSQSECFIHSDESIGFDDAHEYGLYEFKEEIEIMQARILPHH